MVLSKSANNTDCGVVELKDDYTVSVFKEKELRDKQCLVNAGIYLLGREILDLFPAKRSFSIEKEFFPSMCGAISGFVTKERIIDIGTPQRYEKAQSLLGSTN